MPHCAGEVVITDPYIPSALVMQQLDGVDPDYLARTTIALKALAARLVAAELDPGSLVYKPNYNLRGPERLVISFDQIKA